MVIFKRHILSLLVALLISALYVAIFLTITEDFPWFQARDFTQNQIIIFGSLLITPSILMLLLYRFGEVDKNQNVLIHILTNSITTVLITILIVKILRLLSLSLSEPGADYLTIATLAYLSFCIFFLWYQCFLLILNSNRRQVWTLIITGFYFLIGGFTLTFAIELCYLFLI